MILIPSGKSSPNALELKDYLLHAMSRLPVMHLMPMDVPVGKEHPYLITRLASGRYAVKPNITQQCLLFVGMPIEGYDGAISNCTSHIVFQPKMAEEIKSLGKDAWLVNNVKGADFERMLRSYPPYNLLRHGISFADGSKKFRMENPYGLAALYDYPTTLIMMSSDINVALLQATSTYDSKTKNFTPVEKGYGVVFVFELVRPFGFTPYLSNLGKLPFGRAINSRHFLYNMHDVSQFEKLKNVKGFVFHQDKDISDEILRNMWTNGEGLYPNSTDDPVLRKIMSWDSNVVSGYAFEENLKQNPNNNRDDNKKRLENRGISIDYEFDARFTKEELLGMKDYINDIWLNFASDIYSTNAKERDLCDVLHDIESPAIKEGLNVDNTTSHE